MLDFYEQLFLIGTIFNNDFIYELKLLGIKLKIIFLDIDGVMNFSNYYKTINTKEKNWDRFNPISVELLKKLVDETNAKIVIISSWRFGAKQLLFQELLKTGLKKYLHNNWETPQLYGSKRGNEIKLWLDNHPEVTKYVILDDADEILDEQVEYFVKTKIETGFGEEHYQEAERILLE